MERAGCGGGGGGDGGGISAPWVSGLPGSSTTVEPRHNAGSRVSLAKFVRYNEVSIYRGPFSYVLLLLG